MVVRKKDKATVSAATHAAGYPVQSNFNEHLHETQEQKSIEFDFRPSSLQAAKSASSILLFQLSPLPHRPLNGDREKAIAAGCNDYIAKPYNETSLTALLMKYF